MNDEDLLARIAALVDEEHKLEREQAHHLGTNSQAHLRMAELERALDQCWDLLRQRRARRSAGQDVAAAAIRSEDTVEGYIQ